MLCSAKKFSHLLTNNMFLKEKHSKNREKLHKEHLIGCSGVKLSLLKDVTTTTVTATTITYVTINTVTI